MSNPFEPPATPDPSVPGPDPGNPYADPALEDGPWRLGAEAVIPRWRTLAFPADQCVRCGAPATFQLRLPLTWTPGATWLLALFGLMPFLASIMLSRRSADVLLSLCPRHRAARVAASAGSVICLFGAPVMGLVGLRSDSAILDWTALAAFAGMFVALRLQRILVVSKMDGEFAWLQGVHYAILEALPEF